MDGRLIVTRRRPLRPDGPRARPTFGKATVSPGSGCWSEVRDRHEGDSGVGATTGTARGKEHRGSHYDLDHRLYDLFLDADRQYSCAYFEHPDQSLDEAQLAKKRHIAAKLLVDEGHRVLDIGCGFGGMGLYLAQQTGARRDWGDLSARSSSRSPNKPPSETGLDVARRFPPAGLSRRRGSVRPHRGRSACSSMSAWRGSTSFRPRQPAAEPTTASCCCTRSARSGGYRLHQPLGGPSTSSPAAIFPRCPKFCEVDREVTAFTSPTSKYCACTTPTR